MEGSYALQQAKDENVKTKIQFKARLRMQIDNLTKIAEESSTLETLKDQFGKQIDVFLHGIKYREMEKIVSGYQ